MSQPPHSRLSIPPLPQWRRPRGVAPGTWAYVNERSIADHYDAFVADTPLCVLDSQILNETLPAAGTNQPEVVLDLGCGSGRASLPLAQRGYVVVGVDLSLPMLQLMTRKASQSPTTGRVFALRANLAELDCIADGAADHAICLFSTLGMIQGRANRRDFIRHVARIVRPGGSFLLHAHSRWAAVREFRGIRSLTRSWWRSRRSAEHEFGDSTYAYRGLGNMFMHRFSRRELIQDLKASGWLIDQIRPLSIDGSRITSQAALPGRYIISYNSHAI